MPIVRQDDQQVEKIDYFSKERPNLECWLTEPGRLTQFGAFIHVLQPGTGSSIKHWHSNEDELVYVLEGEVTVLEGDSEHLLQVGDAATFKAGVSAGHSLWNRSPRPIKVLVVGTRAPTDCVTYPDHGRMLHRDRSQPEDKWTDLQGNAASNPTLRSRAPRTDFLCPGQGVLPRQGGWIERLTAWQRSSFLFTSWHRSWRLFLRTTG